MTLGLQAAFYLVVLVGCDCDELGLREDAGFKGAVGKLLDVIRLHHVKPRLIFVHGIENRLQKKANLSLINK